MIWPTSCRRYFIYLQVYCSQSKEIMSLTTRASSLNVQTITIIYRKSNTRNDTTNTSALPPGFVTFGALGTIAISATKFSQIALEKRVEEQMDLCKKNGIDCEDLFYDFDLPGDAYPFGDAEGMDWLPKDWKPPKTGDAKFLPTRMLGQLQIRNQLYDITKKAEEKGVDVSDVLVPFFDEDENPCDEKFSTNQKRYMEIRKRLGV